MSRRTGQDGHIEKSGKWFVVRFWKDIPGEEKRMHVRERICPIFGPGLLSKSERKRKAREIIQASGADSAEYFNDVVRRDTGVTFREQSENWLRQQQNRKREPIGQSYAATIQGALDKWILPVVGNLPLANVDNLSVKPLIEKMSAAGLSSRTVNKYIEHVKQVVESLKNPNGEPIHNRIWDAEIMDLPIVEHAEQKRPSFKSKKEWFGQPFTNQGKTLRISGWNDGRKSSSHPVEVSDEEGQTLILTVQAVKNAFLEPAEAAKEREATLHKNWQLEYWQHDLPKGWLNQEVNCGSQKATIAGLEKIGRKTYVALKKTDNTIGHLEVKSFLNVANSESNKHLKQLQETAA